MRNLITGKKVFNLYEFLMINYLKLIRLPNLLIIVLTQYLMRYSIINSILSYKSFELHKNFELQMSDFHFALLVISTVCIAAAGYVINDYFDRRIDQINKPREVIIGNKIDRRHAMILHINLNITGVFIGFYLAYVVHIYLLAVVYIIVTGLFWYYSTNYKRQFLIGNVIVAVLASLVPLQVVLYENVLLIKAYHIEIKEITTVLFWWVAAFSFYAFITNLIREIIKDIEDFEGDNAFGRNSIPVVLGVKSSKIIVIVLLLLFIGTLLFTYYFYLRDNYTVIYLLVCIILPIIWLIITVYKGSSKKDFKKASIILKTIMLTGILYALLAQYIIKNGVAF